MYYFQVAEVGGQSVPWRRPHLPWTVCGQCRRCTGAWFI